MSNKGFLLVMMQPPAGMEDEFTAWYDNEHIPERVAVRGFETGIRFVCTSGFPKFLAIYDMAAPEVLSSPEYLKVSFDQSSPWTKRVTGRVKVDRTAGEQIYPGNKITGICARVMVIRFKNLDSKAAPTIIAGMRSNFESLAETKQMRVLTNVTATGIDYLGFIELRAPISESFDLKPFGNYADSINLVNTYAPY